jgi:Domain of unknown function (DUF222)/HNH endonuclease
MDSNTYSIRPRDGLGALAAVVDGLAGQDLSGLTDAARAERVLVLRRLLDRLEGRWLSELAAVDARGAAGADQGTPAASTAGWLRARLRMGAGAASSAVRTARALFRGPLPATAQALAAGELSPAHVRVLAAGTQELPAHLTAEAEPVLLEAARRLDPPRLRRVVGHLRLAADPEGEQDRAEWRHGRRGLWLTPTWEGMVALDGLLEPEAGQTLMAALEPLARPASAGDTRSGGQRTADALTELARRQLESGRLPQAGGVRPQLTMMVDLDSLLGRSGAVGGEVGGGSGPLDPEACRRLACDGAVTRVLVTRQPSDQPGPTHSGRGPDRSDVLARGQAPRSASPQPSGERWSTASGPGADGLAAPGPDEAATLATRLRTAMALLPPVLSGALTQPLEVGRTSRVVTSAQRTALAVRDGGCVFAGCDRPLAWCEAHHLVHWLDGGPTDLANLALLCRAHHRAVHEGGWRLERGPDGRPTAVPPQRHHRKHDAAARTGGYAPPPLTTQPPQTRRAERSPRAWRGTAARDRWASDRGRRP